MNPEIMKQTGFTQAVKDVNMGNCPFCKKEVNPEDFKDALSKKEFFISGLCQDCQDEMFGV